MKRPLVLIDASLASLRRWARLTVNDPEARPCAAAEAGPVAVVAAVVAAAAASSRDSAVPRARRGMVTR
jgi:hypothetical protein